MNIFPSIYQPIFHRCCDRIVMLLVCMQVNASIHQALKLILAGHRFFLLKGVCWNKHLIDLTIFDQVMTEQKLASADQFLTAYCRGMKIVTQTISKKFSASPKHPFPAQDRKISRVKWNRRPRLIKFGNERRHTNLVADLFWGQSVHAVQV